MTARDGAHRPRIAIPESAWLQTWTILRSRSGGSRESACVWSGDRTHNVWTVRSVLCLEDFGPVDSGRLHHRASRRSVEQVFTEMRRRGEVLVADVHTHPEDWVDLSTTDRAHPIEYRIGLIAVVVPWFASGPPSLQGVGVHEYTATSMWRRLEADEVMDRLQIT